MPNKRVFYACQAVGFAKANQDTGVVDGPVQFAHGVQSVGVTTNFNLEQVFELGQVQIYENIEGVPDVEVTIEKVFDGYTKLIALATPIATLANNLGLVSRSKERCVVGLAIYDDAGDSVDDNAFVQEIKMEGMYLSSLSYNIPVDGNVTESITLVGNSKVYANAVNFMQGATAAFPENANGQGTDSPTNGLSGGIQRRENFDIWNSTLPTSLPGVDSNGLGYVGNLITAHIQNITISTDFSREDILELGRKAPYYRAPSFPIEVTCDIEMIATATDGVQAYEEGDPAFDNTVNAGNNTDVEVIQFLLEDGSNFDLGAQNRLSSVTYGGGDASGGNATVTYSYTNFNDLIVE